MDWWAEERLPSKKPILYSDVMQDGQRPGRVAQLHVSDGKAECNNTRADALASLSKASTLEEVAEENCFQRFSFCFLFLFVCLFTFLSTHYKMLVRKLHQYTTCAVHADRIWIQVTIWIVSNIQEHLNEDIPCIRVVILAHIVFVNLHASLYTTRRGIIK